MRRAERGERLRLRIARARTTLSFLMIPEAYRIVGEAHAEVLSHSGTRGRFEVFAELVDGTFRGHSYIEGRISNSAVYSFHADGCSSIAHRINLPKLTGWLLRLKFEAEFFEALVAIRQEQLAAKERTREPV